MGFRYKAHIQFDRTSLSDEAAEKNLLIQLADRDIISHETLLERFKEIPQIENIRMKRELTKRDTVGPEKAGPFHPPPPPKAKEENAPEPPTPPSQTDEKTDIEIEGGRPLFKQDEGPRKKRVETPKSKPGLATIVVNAEKTWSHISDTITNCYLSSAGKKNLRQLTKAEFKNLEQLKLDVFSNIDVSDDITDNIIYELLSNKTRASSEFMKKIGEYNINLNEMNIEEYRKHIVGIYIELKS